NFMRTRARRCGLVAAQPGCAASAEAIAFSTSARLAKATLACTSPVFGLKTSPHRSEVPFTSLPPMKWPISRIFFLPCPVAVPRAAPGFLSLDSALAQPREAAPTRPLGFLKHAGARVPAGSCRQGGAPVWYASECVHGHLNRPRPGCRSGGAVHAHP